MANDKDFRVKNGLYVATDANILGNTVIAQKLTANGNINFTSSPNVALGPVGNVVITGGSNGQYLQTNGSGGLAWAAVSGASISNGNSNVNIPAANGNVVVSVNGVANITTFTSNAVLRGSYGLTGAISQANTAPSSPQNGDQWYNTFNGILFEYLDDGTSSQWVDISGLPLPNLAAVNASAVLNNVQSTGTYFPAFISSTANGNYALSSNSAFSANLANGALIATTFVGALSGTATSATTAGTVTTAAQPNITSVGTLTSLGVNGTVTAVAFTANTGVFTGNGSGLSAIAGANVTGAVSFATTANAVAGANVSGTVSSATSATTAGTVTTAAQPNITSVGTLTSVAITGNATAGNVYANSGTIGASLLTGTVTTAAQPNITSTGTLTSLTVTGNVAAGNLTTTGVLSVTGTGVSSIAGNLDMTSNTITNLATPTASTDAATKQYVDDVAQGLNIHPSCNAATTTTLASISGGTITYNNGTAGVGATLTTTGSYTTIDGVTLSNGMRILVKNEATQANNGIYVRTSATVLTRATDFDSAIEIAGGDFTFITAGTQYNSTGWVQIDEVTTVGTDPIVWEQFSGAGTYTAGTGLTLTGSTFSVNASQTQVTSVGTLTSLGVTGTTTSGNFATAGNITASFLVSNIATGTAPLTVTSTTRVANLNVAQANVADFISVAAGTGNNFLIFANAATGNITELTSTGLTANLSNNSITATTFVGALSGAATSATSATTAGTVTTAAQPNITSVGTLTGLTSGAATFTTAGAPAVDALTPNNGTTGGLRVRGNATSNVAYIQFTDSAASAQWSFLSVANTGVAAYNATFNPTTLQTTALTAGSNVTAGTITGNWSLSAGSRLTATYADIAEKYVADSTYVPGTVLFFGGEQEVTLANAFDSTKVAGVVTTNPAYSMNSALEADHVAEIALQGRVPCKVIGPIEKGDLMVSASNGHAIANNDARAGTIIGKALENFNGDFGLIEVAVGRF
jgi:hypothetical protein